MAKKQVQETPVEEVPVEETPTTEEDVIVEFESFSQFPQLKLIPHDEIVAQLEARYDAEKPARDALNAKREKLFEELIAIGLSEESAKFLANLE